VSGKAKHAYLACGRVLDHRSKQPKAGRLALELPQTHLVAPSQSEQVLRLRCVAWMSNALQKATEALRVLRSYWTDGLNDEKLLRRQVKTLVAAGDASCKTRIAMRAPGTHL